MTTMEVDFDVGFSAEGEKLAAIAEECSADLQALGATVAFEARRDGGSKASLDWVIPTALAVFITHKYLGTLLEEAAKDHYPKLKATFLRLARRTTGASREVKPTVVSAGKVVESDPVVLSLWVALRDSRKAVFRFDHSISPAELTIALDVLFELIVAHARHDRDDPLGRLPSALPSSSWAPVVMRFDPTIGRWRCWVLDRNGQATLCQEDGA